MGIEENFQAIVGAALSELVADGSLPAAVESGRYSVEKPKKSHGDLACNAALSLAKIAKKKPRDIATLLEEKLLAQPQVEKVEIAGPGFLNLFLAPAAYQGVLQDMAKAGVGYGRGAAGAGPRVLLEFVSANPTGPLLVSHARGALVGDAIGRLLESQGARVSREYYVNDFGNQVKVFAYSVAASAFEEPLPEGGYPGAYVDAVAQYLKREKPEVLAAHKENRDCPDALGELSRQCVARMLDGVPGSADLPGIRKTLGRLGVHFDTFYSEESLHRWGRVAAALSRLSADGYVTPLDDGALVFKMKAGEGEEDSGWHGTKGKAKSTTKKPQADTVGGRIVRKNDGKTYTYFASDIAYHADKLDRGYDLLIDVLGADHHGYVARIRNVLSALGLESDKFGVVLFQLVSLLRDGKPYRMGKRLGNLITVNEVLDEIDESLGEGAGLDALRYFYLSRRTETPVELDVELAKKASLDNPAIYLKYGHARLCSILAKAKTELDLDVPRYSPQLAARLTRPKELEILQLLGAYPRVVREAAKEHNPSKIVFYLQSLAQLFHSYYTVTKQEKDPILPLLTTRNEPDWQDKWDKQRTLARLMWVDAIRQVYAAGLDLIGISAPERMDRQARDEG